MGTQDPNVLNQMMAHGAGHRVRIPAHAWHGVYDAYVVDNDVTNPSVCPTGTCRVIIPSFNPQRIFGPVPYPGPYAPHKGQHSCAAFIDPQVSSPPYDIIRILCFYGWAGATWSEQATTAGGPPAAPIAPGPG